MREYGIPKVLTWRWTPFAGLVLGSLSFAVFAMLVIPDRIGHVDAESTTATLRLGNGFASTQPGPAANWSSSDDNDSATGAATPSQVSRVATRGPDSFPKRGFSPPLERTEPPPAPAPPPPPPPQLIPPPVAEAPPPAPSPAPEAAPPPMADRPDPGPAPDAAAPVLPTGP